MPQNLFGYELSTGLRWIIAFAIVLVLVTLFAFFLRRITGGRLRARGQGGGRARQPRLGVVDIHDLDRQRQLVLIRRDNVEHLVMIGGASDVVIESNIVRGGSRVAAPAQSEFALSERPLAMDTTIPPESLRSEPAEDTRRVPPPLPVAPLPQSAPVPEQLPPLPHRPASPRSEPLPSTPVAATIAVPAAAAVVTAAPNFTRAMPTPAPSASAGELDDMARQLEEALKRPFSAVRPSSQPAEPAPAPAPVPEAPKPQPAPAVKVEEPKPAIVAPVPTAAMAPPVFGRPVGVPADVAAELEMALGLKPEPVAIKAPSPVAPPSPAVQVPPRAVIEPRPAPVPAPVKPPEPAPVAPPKDEPKGKIEDRIAEAIEGKLAALIEADAPAKEPEAKIAEGPKSDEPKSADAKPADVEPADVKPAVAKPVEAGPAEAKSDVKPVESEAPAKPVQIDPFSVDAIEAEFARLLGRDPKPKS
ncbi:hypothetical protein DWF00_09945 [Bosea caraganae]|uniref:Flagellar biosynthesis protein FliO n=1 Tax=Bosea caraganae TaxID=2763117 RepID=A0A370LBS3_9HYPH|nr:flagellar biosynthetic protein FliO [Bosea caraganae]RDJ27283.1 hypothetical protein DWF00_09945 [Bosea caraganae]RDJ29299.1 hypothetical protein DWE98_01715 [Bosea caraganae]